MIIVSISVFFSRSLCQATVILSAIIQELGTYLRTQRQVYALSRAAAADGGFGLKSMHVSEACARWRKATVNDLQPEQHSFRDSGLGAFPERPDELRCVPSPFSFLKVWEVEIHQYAQLLSTNYSRTLSNFHLNGTPLSPTFQLERKHPFRTFQLERNTSLARFPTWNGTSEWTRWTPQLRKLFR